MVFSALMTRRAGKQRFFRRTDRDLRSKEGERKLDKLNFIVHKLNHRPKPTKKGRIKIVCCFSEFGCETLGVLYCIPRLLRRFPGCYVIVVGWSGREYLYRHLVDEFWELREEHMWLRDYSNAMHHRSWNLRRIETVLSQYGDVVPSSLLGQYLVSNFCRTCGWYWSDWKEHHDKCPKCKSTVIFHSMMTDTAIYRKSAVRLPPPSETLMAWARSLVSPRTVGVFARGRKTYGRNLPSSFYVELVRLLEALGYNVVWLGEPQTTLLCPVAHIPDFSRDPRFRDLERTLAVICNLEFTIQFWTASTRLSGLMGVPFLLFESPEQIYASRSGVMAAQEGKRLELTTFGNRKVVLAHYHEAMEHQKEALDLVSRAIHEMREGNYDDIMGMVRDECFALLLKQEYCEMLR